MKSRIAVNLMMIEEVAVTEGHERNSCDEGERRAVHL